MRTTLIRSAAAMSLLLAALLTTHAQTPTDLPKIDVEKFTLPNGLEVILSENHRLPLVGVDLWYHVGPVNEAANRTGFAHLFEHMMFQGSKHLPGDQYFKRLEAAGASGINGTTDFDRTNYFETVPSNQLELALWMESDRMGYLLDQIDQEQLSNQQDVVRNERRQSYENRPYGMVDEAEIHLLFPAEHPYHGNVIGSHADIQAAKLEDVKQFFKLYYRPNNATLAIAGDIDKAATRKLVEKYFGSFKRGVDVPQVRVTTPPLTSERRAVVQDRVQLPRVYMSWITSPYFKEGDADADIAAYVLGGGQSSRLYKKLVYEKQIAQSANASQNSLRLGSIFEIEVTARPGHTAEEIEAAIQDELAKFRADGPTAPEVERARNSFETQMVRGIQYLGGFGGIADRLNLYNHYLGTPDYFGQDILRHRNVTAASVRRFAQEQLKDNARVVVYGVPGTQDLGPNVPTPPPATASAGSGGESVNADESWRATAPRAGATAAVQFPVPQSFQLANGLTGIVAEQRTVPYVAARIVVRSGNDVDPLDKAGLASYALAMLNEGTSTRTALQIADDLAQIGASLTAASTMDASRLTVGSLSRNFPAALQLLADVVLHPSFPAAEVERQQASRLASLVQQRSNPTAIANAAVAAALYGSQHPYGYTENGTTDSTKRITREDLQSFWQKYFVPGNSALIVAGAITLPEVRKLADAAFGGWRSERSAAPALGSPASTKARLVIVDRPGVSQTMLRVASIGAERTSPDYFALEVMNEILGGLFSSRINLNLREAHGYTYGAYSSFTFRRSPGHFAVGSSVRTDVTAPAVKEILSEIANMSATSVTADELAVARDSIERSLPSLFESVDGGFFGGGTLASVADLFIYGLPMNYYSTMASRVRAVDAQAVQTVAKKYLVPDKVVVVAVGDRAAIGKPLEAQLGPAELRDPEAAVIGR